MKSQANNHMTRGLHSGIGDMAKPLESKTYGKSMLFAVCFILLNFASMLLLTAILKAGVAFWAPFLE